MLAFILSNMRLTLSVSQLHTVSRYSTLKATQMRAADIRVERGTASILWISPKRKFKDTSHMEKHLHMIYET